MFIDRVRIHARAGHGGNGSASFRREKYIPKGGPDGGDGGDGGSIILKADPNINQLAALFYQPIIKAKNGQPGSGRQKYGKNGASQIVSVPVGTVVYSLPTPDFARPIPQEALPSVIILDDEKEVGCSAEQAGEGLEQNNQELRPSVFSHEILLEEALEEESRELENPEAKKKDHHGLPDTKSMKEEDLVVDLATPGQEFRLCAGGQGGRGNIHFKSSRNRAPRRFTEGTSGEEGWFLLEMRTIAFAGLLGYPNAGKSTLLGALSKAHPKIGSYPFTTRYPSVGVVDLGAYQTTTVADIPGLVEGASNNRGLGHRFLRHIMRCPFLLMVLDIAGTEGRDPLQDFQDLRRELELYDPALLKRPYAIIANKSDMAEAEKNGMRLKNFLDQKGEKARGKEIPIIPICAVLGEGIEKIKELLALEQSLIPEQQL